MGKDVCRASKGILGIVGCSGGPSDIPGHPGHPRQNAQDALLTSEGILGILARMLRMPVGHPRASWAGSDIRASWALRGHPAAHKLEPFSLTVVHNFRVLVGFKESGVVPKLLTGRCRQQSPGSTFPIKTNQ